MTSLTTHENLTNSTATASPALGEVGAKATIVGEYSARFALAAVIASIGAMKFTAYEAEAISGLVANSPLLSWVYEIMSVRAFATALGLAELVVAAGLVIGAFLPRIGIIAAAAAAGMFVTTLSFLFSTPGAFEPSLGGFPALSVVPGQFLIKDLVLLGVTIWLIGRSLVRHSQS